VNSLRRSEPKALVERTCRQVVDASAAAAKTFQIGRGKIFVYTSTTPSAKTNPAPANEAARCDPAHPNCEQEFT